MIKQNPQLSEIAKEPASLAAAMLMVLVIIFAIVVGTCAAGGALGAKFVSRSGTAN